MEYSKIIAITGLPGLYELVSSKADGGIVRSLDDKTTRFVSSRVHQFSHLESIEVYTNKQNENLVTILKAMEGSQEKLPDEKDPAALKAYFEKVYPELDHSRVYPSDLKKMIRWFSVLHANNVDIKLSEPVEEEAPDTVQEAEEPETKPVKKTAKEKEAVKEKEKPEAKKTPKKEPPSKAEKTEKSTKKEPVEKKAAKATEEKKPAGKEKPKTPAKKKSK